MYDNLENITIKKIKPIILIPLSVVLVIIAIPIAGLVLAIALAVLLLFIVITPILLMFILFIFLINYALLTVNKKIISKKIKPILKEAKHIYNIDILNFEHIVYYKNNHITSVKIPIRFKNISSAIKDFKEKTGSLDSDYLHSMVSKSNAIDYTKKKTGNIFFSTIYYNKHVRNNIHLYDLSGLDKEEIKSLYATELSDEQRFLINKKYSLD